MFPIWLGSETEYALVFIPSTTTKPSQLPGKRLLFESLRSAIGNQVTLAEGAKTPAFQPRYFMENGGCFYFEWHPKNARSGVCEFATPECSSPLQLLHYKKAQQRLLARALPEAQRLLRLRGYQGELKVLKNSRDAYGNVYGEQENYQIEAERSLSYILYCTVVVFTFIPAFVLFLLINVIALLPILAVTIVCIVRSIWHVKQGADENEIEVFFKVFPSLELKSIILCSNLRDQGQTNSCT